jgi:hypothetical protein
MISTGYRNPLYDGITAAINPALPPPTEINPPIIPAADDLTKLTTPSRKLYVADLRECSTLGLVTRTRALGLLDRHSIVGKPLWDDNELGWFPSCGGGCNNNVVRFH